MTSKTVAAVITAYCKGLHADVLIGKILTGWHQDGGEGPALTLASMYVDQFPEHDLARSMAAEHDVPIFDTIEGALTLGGNRVAVDGVISIGEHGDYPVNKKGQMLYPRRRFFAEITDTFVKYGCVVPVFSDKNLGPVWKDAKWMYDRARDLRIPFMAGSSLPVSFRNPEISVPMNAQIEAAVGIGYSSLDKYGSHTIECLQCLIERRQGAETGVQWVQCLKGKHMWDAVDDQIVSSDLIDAALSVLPKEESCKLREGDSAALFLYQCLDGFFGSVLMLPDYVRGIGVALKLKGQRKPLATQFEERLEPSHPHFAYLLKAIERMIHTGYSSYPVERTLLSSGILDRALMSLFQGQQKLWTPELAVDYQPVNYVHAPGIDLNTKPG